MVQIKFDSEHVYMQGDGANAFTKYKPAMSTLTKTMKIPEPHVMAQLEQGKNLMGVAREWVKAHPDLFQDGLKATGGLPAGFAVLNPAAIAALPLDKQVDYYRSYNEFLQQSKAVSGKLTVKVGQKGGISVYGMGRFPTTMYAEQWERLFRDGKAMIEAIIADGYEKVYKGTDSQTGAAWETTLKRKGE